MSWCTLTPELSFDIDRAYRVREHHMPRRTFYGRRYCRECGDWWGADGCGDSIWATDLLSRLSNLLIPVDAKPDRPTPKNGRHDHRYTTKLTVAARRAREAYRVHRATNQTEQTNHRPRPQPSVHWVLNT
jgi:hypothetical protein